MKKLLILVLNFLLFNLITFAQDVVLQGPANCGAAANSGSWQVPCGVNSITIEVYGAGGGGGGGGGGSMGGVCPTYGAGGGGGGGYTTITINVIQGSTFSYSVGAGGCGGSNGGDLSNGGHGNAGGNTTFSGSDSGGNAVNLLANGGARGNRGEGCNAFGGGGGAGSGGAGGTASGGSTNTSGSSGGNGVRRTSSMPSSQVGGNGGNGAGPAGGNGGPETSDIGTTYGGGGAGGGDSAGGRGASGAILITFNGTITTPPTPIIASTPPNCNSAGSSSISNFSTTATYTFSPVGPTVVAGGTINGMTVGTSYTVIAVENGCDSDPSAAFSNLAQVPPPATPTITTTLPTCTNNGTATISNYNASLTYIFSPTGPNAGAGGSITDMTVGQNYTVTASDGSCSSSASSSFNIEGQLPGPQTPTVASTPPNCNSAGSSSITNFSTTATYSFSPAGPTVGAGGAINGMTVGTSYTVIAVENGCDSDPSAAFQNLAQTPAPVAPTVVVTAPSCSANGSAQISNYNGSLNYVFSPTGPTVALNGTINGISFNTNYTIVANDGACNSNPSNSFSVLQQLSNPTASISGNLSYCNGLSSTIVASGGVNYVWYNDSNTSIGNNATISLNQGSYYVEVSNSGGCLDTANVTIVELALPVATLSGITEICEGSSTILTASGGVSYNWNSGQNSESITALNAGSYSVQVTDANGCSSNASIDVTQFSTTPINLGPSVLLCKDSVLVLDAGAGLSDYEWSNGETTQTITPIFSDTYSVTASDNNGCEVTGSISVEFEDCLPPCTIYIPNAFTPQNDGTNDLFLTFSECEPIVFLLSIFNRWGELLFKTNDINEGWDGSFKGEKSAPGVYTFFVNYKFENDQIETIKKGSVTLLN